MDDLGAGRRAQDLRGGRLRARAQDLRGGRLRARAQDLRGGRLRARAQDLRGGRLRARAQDLRGKRLGRGVKGAGVAARRKAEGQGAWRRTFAANDLGAGVAARGLMHALGTCSSTQKPFNTTARFGSPTAWASRTLRGGMGILSACPGSVEAVSLSKSVLGRSAQSWGVHEKATDIRYTETSLSESVLGMSEHLTGGALNVTEM